MQADTLEELSQKLDDVDPVGFIRTVTDWNNSVTTDVPFNPNIKDGRTTKGLAVPKINWTNTLDQPPYLALAGNTSLHND